MGVSSIEGVEEGEGKGGEEIGGVGNITSGGTTGELLDEGGDENMNGEAATEGEGSGGRTYSHRKGLSGSAMIMYR